MFVHILKESGYNQSLLGLSLSYGKTWSPQDELKAYTVAQKLSHKGDGHNKFLESMCVWVDIDAPLKWWEHFDTYRIGMTKQSESDMHTLAKVGVVTADMFETYIPQRILDWLTDSITEYLSGTIGIDELTMRFPSGKLKRRVVCTNYATLQRIIRQRMKHRLPQWRQFCEAVLAQAKFPEFLYKPEYKGKHSEMEVECA